jgi:Kef-type K+ transport system membrane component KefB
MEDSKPFGATDEAGRETGRTGEQAMARRASSSLRRRYVGRRRGADPGRGRRVGVAGYGAFLLATVGLITLAVYLGSGSSAAGRLPAVVNPAGSRVADAVVPTWHLAAAIAAIALLCRFGGSLARRVRQPAVVGEVAAGVLLGPSLFGALTPGLMDRLLPSALRVQLGALANIGVILFVFGLGLELDWSALRRRSHEALWVSHGSIAVPFVGGCFLALALRGFLGPRSAFGPFCLFLGVAMSITALPVLGRILEESGWIRHPVGQLAIVCAAVDDVTAWVVLSVVIAIARSDGWVTTMRTILLAGVLAVVMLGPVRRLLLRVADWPGMASVAVAASVALLAAAASDWIGLHAIFGAFVAGAAMPRRRHLHEEARRLAPLTAAVLLPLFFFLSGLQVNLGRVAHSGPRLLAGLAVLAVAVSGKVGGAVLAGRWVGLPRSERLALGLLLNTRGLTELIVLGVGLQLGVLSRDLYGLMVLMALATTVMTVPLLRWVWSVDREVPAVALASTG